jgi:hypothetical protein
MMKNLPAIAARYKAKILPPDTFQQLMTAAEIEFVQEMNGE